jgi:hypothetical protein
MFRYLALLALLASGSALSAAERAPQYADRWVYSMHNLQVEKSTDEVVQLVDRAAKAGYTGVVLADYKLNILDRVPEGYFRNVARVKKAADAANIELIPLVFPIGYSKGILVHDPNLAAGLPVKDAPFVTKDGRAVPASPPVRIENGDFEAATGDRLLKLGQDGPGKFTFVDRTVAASGKQSLRMQETTADCRISQQVAVRPWASYRLSVRVKTKDFRARQFKFLVRGKSGRPLTFHSGHPKAEQDWTEMDVVFNSLADSEVVVYLGAWGGLKGTAWLDDWRIDEQSLVNVLRRDACPLVVKSADGTTVYEEGKDFLPVKDPKLGNQPDAGEYRFDHPGAEIKLAPNSRIKGGDTLLVSWYHPVAIHGHQVTSSLVDPKVFDVLREQARRVNALLRPKTWFLGHDEIRVAGWSRLAEQSGQTPGRLLANNVKRSTEIIREIDPKARVVVWSDMFDPHHNAVDKYYLVNGPLTGSWEGLSKDVVIANWNGGKAAESLKFFAGRGHTQVIAGYYDGDIRNVRKWDAAAAGVPGVTGFMYTTWKANYAQLEEYVKALTGK